VLEALALRVVADPLEQSADGVLGLFSRRSLHGSAV
jgi:hypothetical protein